MGLSRDPSTIAGHAMTIETVLSRLDRVRQRQPGQWSARCPAHHDRGPSLSIRETPSGGVLLWCFAGCGAEDILAALGLRWSDLFPMSDVQIARSHDRTPRLLTDRQALELEIDERTLIAIIACDMARGKKPSPAECERLRKAAGRLRWLQNLAKEECDV